MTTTLKHNTSSEKELFNMLQKYCNIDNIDGVQDILFNKKYIVNMNKTSVLNQLLLVAVKCSAINIVSFLLSDDRVSQKINIDVKDEYKQTSLMFVAREGNEKIFNLLLNNRADIYVLDNKNNSVLEHAFLYLNEKSFSGYDEFISSKINMIKKLIVEYDYSINNECYEFLNKNKDYEAISSILNTIEKRDLFKDMSVNLKSSPKKSSHKI